MKFKRALVSVSDKTGLVELLRPLIKEGLQIVSTGGTAQHLRSNGMACISVSEITDFPEVMGGRVKTLHPNIHMSLLARDNEEDQILLESYGLKMFDLVVCNLYPFEKVSAQKDVTEEQLIEHIDIGGPTISRAAAKNFKAIVALCDPKDYGDFLKLKDQITMEQRKKWAAKVFSQTSRYDALIAQVLAQGAEKESFSIQGQVVQTLRYGENAQQKSMWFAESFQSEGLQSSQVIQGKALSYNNLLDLDAACSLIRLFKHPTVVAVKHNNPCGVASDKNPLKALKKALTSDPVSVFGAIVAINQTVDQEMAQELQELFLECVIAPALTPEAEVVFSKKKNLRVLIWKGMSEFVQTKEVRSISGGYLVQSTDQRFGHIEDWDLNGSSPSSEIKEDMVFGEKVCAFQKSNAIAIVKNQQTLGLGMGQVNRIDALDQAIQRWKKFHPEVKDPILVSDAFFPFSDSVELAYQSEIHWILQPGGSVRDEEVKNKAKELGIQLVFSGVRHFKH